jgi:two-component system chemotaxis response regulator CheY
MSKLILTIDDSRSMREMLRLALSETGFEVVQAVDGVDGIEVLKGCKPDVIVTDVNMPRMDGFGVIQAVRQDPLKKHIPILVLTTESDAAKKQRAKEAGATGWIVKPFDPVKLVAAINRVVA